MPEIERDGLFSRTSPAFDKSDELISVMKSALHYGAIQRSIRAISSPLICQFYRLLYDDSFSRPVTVRTFWTTGLNSTGKDNFAAVEH